MLQITTKINCAVVLTQCSSPLALMIAVFEMCGRDRGRRKVRPGSQSSEMRLGSRWPKGEAWVTVIGVARGIAVAGDVLTLARAARRRRAVGRVRRRVGPGPRPARHHGRRRRDQGHRRHAALAGGPRAGCGRAAAARR